MEVFGSNRSDPRFERSSSRIYCPWWT